MHKNRSRNNYPIFKGKCIEYSDRIFKLMNDSLEYKKAYKLWVTQIIHYLLWGLNKANISRKSVILALDGSKIMIRLIDCLIRYASWMDEEITKSLRELHINLFLLEVNHFLPIDLIAYVRYYINNPKKSSLYDSLLRDQMSKVSVKRTNCTNT